jgi:parvulin-like peptidyl-prolyl isomerase
MYQDYYADRDPDQVAAVFGSAFVASILALKDESSWQGPVESGFGWHLVRLESRTPTRVPAFAEVEAAVRIDWIEEQRADTQRKTFAALRRRYTVVLPDRAPLSARAGAPADAR